MRTLSDNKARKQFGAKRLNAMLDDADPDLKMVDFRDPVSEVLQEVDKQLSMHGLEVVLHDTGDDNYVWHVQKIEMPQCFYQPEPNAEAWDDKMFQARMVFRDKKKAQEKFPDLKIVVLHPSQVENPMFVDDYKLLGD